VWKDKPDHSQDLLLAQDQDRVLWMKSEDVREMRDPDPEAGQDRDRGLGRDPLQEEEKEEDLDLIEESEEDPGQDLTIELEEHRDCLWAESERSEK
jgi:hypothetical protein